MRSLAVLTLALFAALGSAQITKSGSAYLLRMKHTPGATYRYGVASTIGGASANGQAMKFSLPMVWKVVGVKNNIATIDTTVGPIKMGKDVVGQATKNRIQLNSRGQLVGKAGSGQQVTPSLPDKPIKIGQSWSASAPIDLPGQGAKKISAQYTLKGFKTVSGKQVAELAIKTTGQAAGTGSMLLLMSDGSLFRSNMNLNLSVTGPNGAAMTYKVTANISRQ